MVEVNSELPAHSQAVHCCYAGWEFAVFLPSTRLSRLQKCIQRDEPPISALVVPATSRAAWPINCGCLRIIQRAPSARDAAPTSFTALISHACHAKFSANDLQHTVLIACRYFCFIPPIQVATHIYCCNFSFNNFKSIKRERDVILYNILLYNISISVYYLFKNIYKML